MKTYLILLLLLILSPCFAQTQIGSAINAGNPSNGFGFSNSFSLNVDGDVIAVGYMALNKVQVYSYDTLLKKWVIYGVEIKGDDLTGFGGYVSISSNAKYLAIGAIYSSRTNKQVGETTIYEFKGNEWVEKGNSIEGVNEFDNSGIVSISEDGSTVCIGERGNDDNGSNSGQVRVFKYSDVISDWNQVGFDIEGESANDFSGSPVRITGDGNRVAIGAYGNDDGGSNSGHVRVFRINSSVLLKYNSLAIHNVHRVLQVLKVVLLKYNSLAIHNQAA